VKCLVRRRGEEYVSVSVDLSHPFHFVHLFISAHIIIEFVPADFPAVPGKAPVVDTEDTVCNARQCNARETKERKGRNAIADPKVLAKKEWRKEREKRVEFELDVDVDGLDAESRIVPLAPMIRQPLQCNCSY